MKKLLSMLCIMSIIMGCVSPANVSARSSSAKPDRTETTICTKKDGFQLYVKDMAICEDVDVETDSDIDEEFEGTAIDTEDTDVDTIAKTKHIKGCKGTKFRILVKKSDKRKYKSMVCKSSDSDAVSIKNNGIVKILGKTSKKVKLTVTIKSRKKGKSYKSKKDYDKTKFVFYVSGVSDKKCWTNYHLAFFDAAKNCEGTATSTGYKVCDACNRIKLTYSDFSQPVGVAKTYKVISDGQQKTITFTLVHTWATDTTFNGYKEDGYWKDERCSKGKGNGVVAWVYDEDDNITGAWYMHTCTVCGTSRRVQGKLPDEAPSVNK